VFQTESSVVADAQPSGMQSTETDTEKSTEKSTKKSSGKSTKLSQIFLKPRIKRNYELNGMVTKADSYSRLPSHA
jgi:hypothetical protein